MSPPTPAPGGGGGNGQPAEAHNTYVCCRARQAAAGQQATVTEHWRQHVNRVSSRRQEQLQALHILASRLPKPPELGPASSLNSAPGGGNLARRPSSLVRRHHPKMSTLQHRPHMSSCKPSWSVCSMTAVVSEGLWQTLLVFRAHVIGIARAVGA